VTKSYAAVAASADESSRAPSFRDLSGREAAILAAILIATIAVYLPSLRNGWVFDDTSQIVKSLPLHNWTGIGKSFIYDSWWFLAPNHLPQSAYYRPLQASWFGLNFMIFGNHPAAWHLEKIVLQLIGVVLCFRVAQLLTRSSAIALLTAGIFALLPANTESVVWVSAIGEPLSTAFELGALCCLINRKPGLSRGLVFALLLYAGALLTHETAILFSAIVAAYVFLFEAGEERPARRVVAAVRTCVPFVVLAAIYMGARLNALGVDFLFGVPQTITSGVVRGMVEARAHHSLVETLMTLPMVLLAYPAVLAVPWLADPTHPIDWITRPQPVVFLAWAAVVLLMATMSLAAWRSSHRRIYLFCAVWSVITIAPALNLNALWYLVDDRYLYAPSFGWSLAVATAAMQIVASGSRARKTVGVAFAFILAASVVSIARTERYWYDDVAFFQRCVQIKPSDPGYRIRLAEAMNIAGDKNGAALALERGTELNPDDAYMRLKLAQQYQMMGRDMDFEREFQKFNELSAANAMRNQAAQNSDASPPAGAP
jgi:hypothetical protein